MRCECSWIDRQGQGYGCWMKIENSCVGRQGQGYDC